MWLCSKRQEFTFHQVSCIYTSVNQSIKSESDVLQSIYEITKSATGEILISMVRVKLFSWKVAIQSINQTGDVVCLYLNKVIKISHQFYYQSSVAGILF